MKRRPRRLCASPVTGGHYTFQRPGGKALTGFGDGEFIHLRDEHGNTWRGHAERLSDSTVMYRFRDPEGNALMGVSDQYGITLRDDHGNAWRGFVH